MIGGVENQVTAKILRMAFRQWQTQTKTLRQVIDLGKGIEDKVMSFLWQARPLILCNKPYSRRGLIHKKGYMLLIRILGRIIQQFTKRTHQIEMV